MSVIEKITLDLGEKKIELSLDEARELNELLDNLFHGKERYFPVPYYPIPIYTPPYRYWEPIITCGGNTTPSKNVTYVLSTSAS